MILVEFEFPISLFKSAAFIICCVFVVLFIVTDCVQRLLFFFHPYCNARKDFGRDILRSKFGGTSTASSRLYFHMPKILFFYSTLTSSPRTMAANVVVGTRLQGQNTSYKPQDLAAGGQQVVMKQVDCIFMRRQKPFQTNHRTRTFCTTYPRRFADLPFCS